MAIRSVVDIDINDGRFKEFSAAFEKYQALLAKTPGAWANMDKSMKSGFSTLSSALLAQLDIINKTNKAEQDLNNTSNKAASAWRDISKSTKSVLTNIKDMTISLFKWASVGSIFTGLLGAGSLFGLTELAGGVGATRRQALGIGTTYGEKRAFDVNYGRIVDSDSYLSNVNTALHDVTKRSALYSAGLSDADLRGKDTAQVALALISKLKELADKTNPALLGQVLEARRQDQFISLNDFERLRNTSKSELGDYARAFGRDTGAFGQDERTQRAWQDFSVQMSRAGQKIESVFVRGLEPLVPALSKLSDSVAKSIGTLLSSPELGKWLEAFGQGIEGAAKYIGGTDFQNDLKEFATDVGLVAKALVNALKWLGVIPDKDSGAGGGYAYKDNPALAKYRGIQRQIIEDQARRGQFGGLFGLTALYGLTPNDFSPVARQGTGKPSIAESHHNPGNLRKWGNYPVVDGYVQFPDDRTGLHALEDQFYLYTHRDKLNTIDAIINKYAPAKDHNNPKAYADYVAHQAGLKPSQTFNPDDMKTVARILSAMMRFEGFRTPGGGKIMIENNTGGNAIITASQLRQ